MLVYEPNLQFRTFILVGCGGTGSRIASMLSQFVASTCNHPTIKPLIVFIDDDVVEPKNLARQLFSSADVGEYKAEALARRYSSAFGIQIIPVVARAKSPVFYHGESIRDIIVAALTDRGVATTDDAACRMLEKPTILITAVDSVDARRDILAGWISRPTLHAPGQVSNMDTLATTVVIDPGNAAITGQVSVFNPVLWPCSRSVTDWNNSVYSRSAESNNGGRSLNMNEVVAALPERLGAEQRVSTLPMPWMRYLKSKGSVNAPSCADLDQTLAVNSLVATASFTLVQNLIFGVPLRSLTAYFSVDLDNHTKKMTYPWLKGVLTGDDKDYFTTDDFSDWLDETCQKFSPEEGRQLIGLLDNLKGAMRDRYNDPSFVLTRVTHVMRSRGWDDLGHNGALTIGQVSMMAYFPRRLIPAHILWPKQDTNGMIPGSLRAFLSMACQREMMTYLYQHIRTGKWEPTPDPDTVAPPCPVLDPSPTIDDVDALIVVDEGVPLGETATIDIESETHSPVGGETFALSA